MPDPADTREKLLESSDLETSALHELLEGLEEMNGTDGYTAGQILRRLEDTPTCFDRVRAAIPLAAARMRSI